VYTLLLGGAVPESLYGTTDHTYHTHYSLLSTVSVNWDLPSLGRWDCQAAVFDFVAGKAGGVQIPTEDTCGMFRDSARTGPLSSKKFTPGQWPAPATNESCIAGNGVLDSVKSTWGGLDTEYLQSAGSDSAASRELDGASATVVIGLSLLMISLGQ
jgi:acid phosphatase